MVPATTGRLDQARRFLVRVLTYAWTVPTYPAALVLLGQLDEQRRDRPEAARAYRTALDAWRDPDPSLLPARRKAEDGWRRLNAAP